MESPYVSLLRGDSERIQWEFVGAGRQERQDKWKRKRCAHQATGQATVQWCPGGEQSRHLFQWREICERETAACTDAELELSGDKEVMQPLESRLAELKWSKTDRTTGQRIALSHFEVPEAPRESGDCQSGSRSHYYQRDRGHRELPGSTRGTRTTPCFICGVSQGRWTGQRDARVASKHFHQSPNTCRRAATSTEMQLHNHFSVCWFQHLRLTHQMRCGVEHWTIRTRAAQTGHRTRTKCGSQRRR